MLIMETLLVVVFFSVLSCSSHPAAPADTSDRSILVEMNQGEDTLEFADRVLKYVVQHSDVGFQQNAFCDTFYKVPIEQFVPEDYFELFETDQGVVSCGLASQLMTKILMQNGIDAYTYDFGIDGTMFTHVVVLVKYRGKLVIYDPLFNYTVRSSAGDIIGLLEVLDQIQNGNLDIELRSDSTWSDMVIDKTEFSPTKELLEKNSDCHAFLEGFRPVNEETQKKTYLRSFGSDRDSECFSFIRGFEQLLQEAHGLPRFHYGLILKRNEIYGAPDHREVNALINAALAEMDAEPR